MTVPKKMVKEYLDQLDWIDTLERRRVDAYCRGNFEAYHDICSDLHKEEQVAFELREQLVKAVK